MDRTLWPMTLVSVIGGITLKFEVKYSPSKKKYCVKVNGIDFFELPFRVNTYNPDALTHYMDAEIEVN